MQRCGRCHFTRTTDDVPDGDLCPECGCAGGGPRPIFRVYKFAVPLAFRTSLYPGKDAKEEDDLLAMGTASVAESEPRPCNDVPRTNSATAYSSAGRVYRVNDRRGQLFTGQLGTTTTRAGKVLGSQWIDERFQDADGITFLDLRPNRITSAGFAEDNGCPAGQAGIRDCRPQARSTRIFRGSAGRVLLGGLHSPLSRCRAT